MQAELTRSLIIDHYDSFTHNVMRWIEPLFTQVEIIAYDQLTPELDLLNYDLIILSPGPGAPHDYPETVALFASLVGRVPILGICLGMQIIAHHFNYPVVQLAAPLHGKSTTLLNLRPSAFLNGCDKEFAVAHYHSLVVENSDWEDIVATDINQSYVNALESESLKYLAVQFHPESFLTQERARLLTNLAHWISHAK